MTYYKLDPSKEPTPFDVMAHMEQVWETQNKKYPTLYPEDSREEYFEDYYQGFYNHLCQQAAEPLDTVEYNIPPVHGDLIEVDKFRAACENGGFIDYDGYGSPVKDGMLSSMTIRPRFVHLIPKDATHIMWFNR